MLAASRTRCRTRRRLLLLPLFFLFCCLLSPTIAFLDEQEDMMENLRHMAHEEVDFEVDEEADQWIEHYFKLAERRLKIEQAVTPPEILENATLYYFQQLYEGPPGVPLIMPGKFINLEHDGHSSRLLVIHMKMLTFTALNWKVPKSKKDYRKDLEEWKLLEEEDDVDDILGEGLMMLTDFFGMHLQELHIYQTDAEVAILRKQIAQRQAEEDEEGGDEKEELEDEHIEEDDGLPAFDLDFDPHDGEL
ncbi:hypothetical protein M3Y99_00531800 [Aphelenchoides fujianensis]|nr:hypothetical protein M3Y99_00531800 [Aphelenchoides fujianensis]